VSISPNFLTNLKTNEGYRNDVYRDSLGVLTAGVGHKLTNAELGQYKEGDTIDDALISKWLDQDSTKAYTAATQQANQLGQGGNSNFIDALGEVNFQLGTNWYKDHQNTWGLMQQGNFSGAATEAAVSDWNDQTPKRVQNFQAALQQLQADQPEPIELPTAQTEPTQPQRGPIANLFDVGDPFAPNTKAIEAVSGAFAGERVEGLGDAQGQLSLGETFGEAVRAGGKQFESDVYTFGAIGNLLTGNDEAARAKLGKAKILDDSASEILSQMGAFEEFYDAPTFSGFVEQVVKGVGSFTPMAMTSVISAGVGGIVANLGKGGVTFASRAFLKKKFNTIARKEKNNIKLTAAEAEFVENGYNAAKAARTYTSTTATKIGMGVGAFGQEYVVGSSQALKEYDDAGFELTKEEAKMAAALGIPQALLGTLSEGLFFRSMTKMALKDAVGGDMAAGAFMKELAKAVAIKSGQSFVVEGVTETLQEGTLVAQRFAIDPNYSAQEAKMRIMESAFVGAFAGGARAAPTSVIAKAYNLLSTGREVQADLNQEESQQVLDGRTQVEPDADLIAQIDDLVNPEAERQAVVLENTTKEQAIEIVKNIWGTARTAELQKIEKDHAEEVAKVNNDVSLSPAERGKKLRRLNKVKEIAIKRAKDEAPKTTIKDVDILVDEEKGSVAIVNAENATTIEQEMLQRGGLTEEYKQELLGFSQPQNIDDEIVFVVKDKNGNHVFTQSTNKAGEKVAEKNVRDRYKKELAAGKVTVTKGDKAQIGEEKQARLNKEQEAKKGPEKATVKDVVDDNDPAYTENDDPTYETAGQTEFGQNLGRTLQESEMGKEISEGQAIEEGFSASSREANNLELAGKNAKSPYGRVLALSSYTNQETAARNKANEQEKATFLNALDSDADRSFWTSYVDGVQRIDDVPKGTLKNFTDISEKNQNTTYILSEVPAIDKEGNPIEGQKAYQVLADLSQEQEGFERAVQKATQASYRQQRAEINDSPEARAFTIEIPAVDEKGKLIEGKTTSPAVDIITLINYAIYQADLDASSTSIATDSALSPAERNRQGFKELVAIAEELGRPLYYKGKRVVSMTDAELNAVQISSFKKQGDKFILNKAGSVEVGVPIKKEPVSNKALNTIINSDIKQIVGSLTGVEGTLEQLAFDIGSGNTLEQQVPVYEENKDGTNKVDNKGNPIPKLNNAGEPIFKTERTTSGANTVQNIVTGADMKVRRQEIVFITNESKLNREKPFGRYEGYTRQIFENEFLDSIGYTVNIDAKGKITYIPKTQTTQPTQTTELDRTQYNKFMGPEYVGRGSYQAFISDLRKQGRTQAQINAISLQIREVHVADLQAQYPQLGIEGIEKNGSTILLTPEGKKLLMKLEPTATRLMVGNHGVYIEMSEPANKGTFVKKRLQYNEYKKEGIKLYDQFKTVNYANYKTDKWYADPTQYAGLKTQPTQPTQTTGKKIVHFTLSENVSKILEEGFDTTLPPIHGMGDKGKEGGTGKAAEDVLYFTTDEDRWSTTKVYVGEGKGNVDYVYYNYDTQEWVTEKNAAKTVNLAKVEAVIKENARVLTIDSFDKLNKLTPDQYRKEKLQAVIKKAKADGYDVVNIKYEDAKKWEIENLNTPGEAIFDDTTLQGGKDDYFVLNKGALELGATQPTQTTGKVLSERQYLKQFQEYLQDIAQEEGIFTDSEAASLNEETTVETTERTEDQRQQESAIRGEDLGQFGYENHINALNANSAKIGKTYLSTQKQRGVENKRTSATQRVKDYFKRENLFGDFAGAKGDSIVDVLLNAINTQLKYGRTLRIISLDDDIVLGSEFNDIYVDEKGVRRNAKWIVKNIKEDMRKTGKPARIVEFGAQGDVIILNLQQKPTDEQFAFMLRALGHEIGHGVYKHELERSLEIPQLKKLLDNAFAKAKKALQEAVGVDENGRQKLTKYDGEIGFEEWYADQYSVYALDPDQKATNFVQSYFKLIIQRLKKFFDIVNKQVKGRFTLDPDFVSYMNGVQQVANISPPGNKRTTFNNFTRDQKAEVYRVLDVMEQTVDTPKGVSRQALGFIKRQVEALLRAPLPLLPTDKKHISLNFVFKTAHGYLKEISPALAAIMYSESQSEDKSGYINVRILVINQKLNQIYSLVPKKKNGEPNIEALTRIAEEAEASTPTAELGPEARQMREFLSEFYDTYIDGNLEGVLKLPNFFPRKWSLAELRQSPEKRAIMAKLLRKYNPDVKQITDGNATTYEDWESYVKSWLETDQDNESIAKTDNGISSLSLGMDQARVKYFKAIPTEAARRGLNEQGEINPEGSKDIELINPAAYSLKAYIEDTVKRVEYDKRAQATATKADWYNIKRDLGENEANRIATSIANKNLAAKKTGTKAKFNKEEEAFLKIGYNASKIQLGEKAANVIVGNINAKDFKNPDLTGWKATEVLLARIEGKNDRVGARRAMEAMLGRVGLGMSGWARQVNSWGLLTNMMTLLAFTTLASLPDLAGPILRSKGINNFGQTMDQLKYYFKNREAAEQFAKDLGVITHDSLETMYINAAELGFMTKETKFLANKFFKVIGLDFFTKFTRVFAAGMGEQFLINLAKTNDADSNRYLRELDLTREEVLAWSKSENKRDFSGPEGAKIKAAVGRFVEESIVRPSAAERPVWASNPYTALIWQLKSFFYAYGKNIIGGAIREAKNRHAKDGSIPSAALPLILGAVTLLPLTALGLEIREFIKYLVRGGDAAAFRSDNMPWGEYFLEMLDRSGVLGAYGLIYGMMQANKYGNSWFVNGLGPTAERVENLWQGNAKLKDYNPFSI
jgi:lysozyme